MTKQPQEHLFRALALATLLTFGIPPKGIAQTNAGPLEELLSHLDQNYKTLETFKAFLEFKVGSIASPPSKEAFAQLAFQKNPRRFYFKSFSPLTPNYFTLISEEDQFWLKVPKLKKIFKGPLQAIGQEDFELKIKPQDFEKILATEPINVERENLNILETPQAWVIEVYQPTNTSRTKIREVWLSKSPLRVQREIRYSVSGQVYLEINWGLEISPNTSGDSPLRRILVLKPLEGIQLEFLIKKQGWNTKLPEEIFTIEEEEGFQIQEVAF